MRALRGVGTNARSAELVTASAGGLAPALRDVYAPRARSAALVGLLAAVVAAVVALGVVAWDGGSEHTGVAPRTSGSAGAAPFGSLPLQAQAVISNAVATGEAEFAARRARGGYRSRGGGVSARFGAGGAVVRAGAGSVAFSSLAIGRGSRLVPVGALSLTARGNRVTYTRDGVSEWYAAGPLGIEQGLRLSHRPAGTGRSLTIGVAISGSLRARVAGASVRFVDRTGRAEIRYGGLVAVDATGRRLPATLAVDHHQLLVRVVDRSARYPVRIDPLVQAAKIVPPSDLVGDANGFASQIALSGDGQTALVSSPGDNSNAGAAWVFVNDDGVWTVQKKLVVSGSGRFGESVALSEDGNTAAVGGSGGTVNQGGDVWIFTRSGTTWTQQDDSFEPCCGVGLSFGSAISLSSDGDTALVGGGEGIAWVMTRTGTTWSTPVSILDPDLPTDGGDDFGDVVALSGDGQTALIGKPAGGPVDNPGGEVYVYTGSGDDFSLQQAIVPGDERQASDGDFGISVALSDDGDTALIGGNSDSSTGTPNFQGAAWVYTRSGATWTEQQKITPADELDNGAVGSGVALSADGNTALIGGNGDDNQGAAWLYTRGGSTWTNRQKLIPSTGTGTFTGFGSQVALSSDGTVGIVNGRDFPAETGAVWVFGSHGRTSATSVRCVSSASPPLQCTATVSDSSGQSPADIPTGMVSFSATMGGLAAQRCTLAAVSGSSAACSVGFTPSAQTSASPTQITAAYPGDSQFARSVGTATLNDLVLTMSDDPSGSGAERRETYSITVSNVGPAVTNVQVRDDLPPQVAYQSGGGTEATCTAPTGRHIQNPQLGGGSVLCTIAAIGQNGGVTFTINTSIDNASEQLGNFAIVNPFRTIGETNYSNDSQHVETRIALPQGQGWQLTWQKLQDQLGASDFRKLVTHAMLFSQCASYQREILQRLDAVRESDPAALKGLAYGPITDQIHNGVVVYLQGTSYFDTGVVIHGTASNGLYQLPGQDILAGEHHNNPGTWATGEFLATPITRWEAFAKYIHSVAPPIHELDDVYGYYFEGTYPATGTFLGQTSPGTCPIAPHAMVVSTRSPVEIHLVNSAGQQLQTQAGAVAVDQFASPVTGDLGVDAAGNFDWDLVLPVDRYKVTLVGTASGPYTLILTGYDAKGTPIQTTIHGTITAGQTTGLTFVPPADVVNRFGLSVARAGDRIVLKVKAPGPGSIIAKAQTTVRPGRTSAQAHRIYGRASATVPRRDRVRLVIRPGKVGRALSRRRPIRLSVAVTFSPTGGLPRTKHGSVTIKPVRPHKTRS